MFKLAKAFLMTTEASSLPALFKAFITACSDSFFLKPSASRAEIASPITPDSADDVGVTPADAAYSANLSFNSTMIRSAVFFPIPGTLDNVAASALVMAPISWSLVNRREWSVPVLGQPPLR